MNLLICEDNTDIQDLLEIIINDMGINIFQCNDKISMFKNLENKKIDLVILDYWLKKRRADEILLKLKKDYAKMPIILMSAISDLPELAKKFNVEDYIKKPFNIDELKNKISTLLNV